MFYVIEKDNLSKCIESYEHLCEISESLEWQDVCGGAYAIVDDEGNTYGWDDSKHESEYGSVYKYTLKVIGKNVELANYCLSASTNST